MDDPKFRSQIEVLSVVDKGRRRDWADAEKVRIVEESLRGYRQCAATARRHEISRAFLTRWRRDFRSGQLVSEGRPQFMAVQVSADTDGSGGRQPQGPATSGSGNLRGLATSGGRQPQGFGNLRGPATSGVWQPRGSGNLGGLATSGVWQPQGSGNLRGPATSGVRQPRGSGN